MKTFNPIILILILSAFNAYIPHINYPYPLHVDEWFHITTAEEIVRGDKIDLYSGQPFQLGMERAWHLTLAGIFLFVPPLKAYIFMVMALSALATLSIYTFAKRYGERTALIAAFLAAIIPSSVTIGGPALLGRYYFEERWLKRYKDTPTMTVSNSTKENLLELGFRNVSIVPEGIKFKPLKRVPLKEKEPTFIFVGRLKKAKKPQDAVKAFNIVKKEIKSARLWVVGDGYHRKEVEKIAGDGVRFFGKVTDEKKLKLMSRAHAILVPGVREGWGLIVTEANACGTPAIAYDVPGLRDSCQDFKNGILVGARPEKMAEVMMNLATNKELRERLSRDALEHSRQFSWDRSAKETLSILEGVVNG